jgi:hypothetical protein
VLKPIYEPTLKTWLIELRSESKIAYALMKMGERTTENGNYLSYDKKSGLFSYSPRRTNKEGEQLPLGFKAKGRVSGKTGRVIRKFLMTPEAYSDGEWEAFHNSIVALSQGNLYYFGFVRGSDIQKFYDEANYSKSPRQKIYSCMQGKHAQEYLGIYTENPNTVELFVCFDSRNNLVLGRSIVWTCTDGKKYHDSVYGGDIIRQAMMNELKSQGIITLNYEDSKELEVDLDNVLFACYPSVDRFRYLDTVKKKARMHEKDYTIIMSGTNGKEWYVKPVTCSVCQKQVSLQMAVAGDNQPYCKDCAEKLQFTDRRELIDAEGATYAYPYNRY